MSRGLMLAELGRIRYEERQREEMLANIPWRGQEERQNQEIMEDDGRVDVESDASSEHSVHNTDSEQSDVEVEDFVYEVDDNPAYTAKHHFTGKDKKLTGWLILHDLTYECLQRILLVIFPE